MNKTYLPSLFLIVTFFLPANGVALSCKQLETSQKPVVISTPKDYIELLGCKSKFGKVQVHGLFGRVLKGKNPEDFRTLSYDPQRKIIFFMGDDGLKELLGLDNRRILTKIGYTEDYINQLKATGYKFKLVVFRKHSGDIFPATWNNIAKLTEKTYPTVATKIHAQLAGLKTKKISEIEAQSPARFADIDKAGKDHPHYINAEKLAQSEGKLWEVRAFLYYQLRLMELFSGNGITQTSDGSPGLKEFIGMNQPIDSLKEPVVFDLD